MIKKLLERLGKPPEDKRGGQIAPMPSKSVLLPDGPPWRTDVNS